MIQPLRSARRMVSLAGRSTLFAGGVERWLVGLRWIALVGMASTTLLARLALPGLRTTPILAVIALGALGNVAWHFVARARDRHVTAQILGDVATLAAVLWLSGGVGNPFVVFVVFQIALAGVLTDGRTTALVTAATVAVVIALTFAPPLPWATSRMQVELVRTLATFASLLGLALFSGVTAYVYGRRLSELRSAKARDERLAVLGRLAGGVAHELNTPLATILLASNELVEVGAEQGDPEIERLSRTLAAEAKRASDVIDLLRGRVHAGLSSEAFDASSFVRELVASELSRLGFGGEHVVVAAPSVTAWGSRAALRQILENVLKNAVEATRETREPRIEVTVTKQGGGVAIRVRDNGHGIRPEDLQRVGEPFRTTKLGSGGTGLGLYISSVLAGQMRASLELESHEGQETCVTLTLARDTFDRASTRPPAMDDDEDDGDDDDDEVEGDATN
jgi:two-component system sensor histidine kinase RegB